MKEFGCDMAIEDLSGFYPCNCMSSKKEKCCECTSKERPSHVFRSSGTPGMKDGGYFTCNCPCHQSESIEWKDREYEFEVLTSYESPYAGKSSIQHQAYREGASKMFDVLLPHLKQAITTAVAKRELEIVEEVEKKSFRGFAPYEQDYLIKKEDVLSILKH